MKFLSTCAVLLAAAFSFAPAPAGAQAFPNKPIRFIVPYPPGGPTDLTARVYADKISRELGQPVVVENKPGAQGLPAVQQLMQQPSDGYTMYFGTLSTQVVAHVINAYRKAPMAYDARRDLTPVSLLGSTSLVIIAGNATPASSLKELIALAKAQPGKLNYGSDGIASLTHLGSEMLNQAAGIQTVHIPYKGTAEFTQAIISGDIQFATSGSIGALNLQKAGRAKLLAVASPRRTALIPDVPTVAEAGYPGFDLTSWFAVYVKAGAPQANVQTLAAAIQKVATDPDLIQRLNTAGLDVMTNTPEQFSALMDAEFRKWTTVIDKAALKFDN